MEWFVWMLEADAGRKPERDSQCSTRQKVLMPEEHAASALVWAGAKSRSWAPASTVNRATAPLDGGGETIHQQYFHR